MSQDTLTDLVKGLQLHMEMDRVLALGHWSEYDCAYSLSIDQDDAGIDYLARIFATWEKPGSSVSPVWYFNEILKMQPPSIHWMKVDKYLHRLRYRYENLSRKDRGAFKKSHPYIIKEINKIITAEKDAGATTSSSQEKVSVRDQRLLDEGVKILMANSSWKAQAIYSVLIEMEKGTVSRDMLKHIAPLWKMRQEAERRKR